MGREVVATGQEAVVKTAEGLKADMSWTFRDQWGNEHTLNAGDMWGDTMMFVVKIDYVYYTEDNTLYKLDDGTFIRDIYLSAYAKGISKASWLVPILKAEMTLCMALCGTLAAGLGTIAAVVTSLGHLVTFYNNNKVMINAAWPVAKELLALLDAFEDRCPTLYKFMRNTALKKAVGSIPDGFSLDDMAYFLGKLIGKLGNAGNEVGKVSFKIFVKSLGAALGVLLALRGTPMSIRGSAKNVKKLVEDLKKEGIKISDEGAKEILQDNCLDTKVNQEKFEEIQEKAEKLQEYLKELEEAFSRRGD